MAKRLIALKKKGLKMAPPVEQDFSFAKVYEKVQRGLPTPYRFCDFYSILSLPPTTAEFISDLHQLYIDCNAQASETCLIMAFNPIYWNKISPNQAQIPNFDYRYHQHYKNNLQILFIHKKKTKTAASQITDKVKNFIAKYNLSSENSDCLTRGMSQANDDVSDTVLGGKFNDNIETPKDPYSFALHGLIGYQNSNHLGGSYLFAQKIDLKWETLGPQELRHQQIIGRIKIQGNKNDDSTIFSQDWCPHSHIKNSRVKDQYGNPIQMVRQSKPYFTEDPIPGILSRQKGVFFIGYLNKPSHILKIVESQYGTDALIKYFNALYGNILYVPNVLQLSCEIKLQSQNKLKGLSQYHGMDWGNAFPGVQEPSPSPYLFYTRAQYLQKMSTAQDAEALVLNPPTPRTLRILSKTFALWQDTWYYDRRQPEMGKLSDYLVIYRNQMSKFCKTKYFPKSLSSIKWGSLSSKDDTSYADIPIALRQALAVYCQLTYILTSEEYGCRGPNKNGVFGAATFHVQPEDILVGGEANLTFGQGKHLLDYMTDQERQQGWYNGKTITEHSGVGHVVPHLDFIMKNGLQALISKFNDKLIQVIKKNKQPRILHLYEGAIIALKGMQNYFLNYAALCEKRCVALNPSQQYSIENLTKLASDLKAIATDKPANFRQAAQLALSVFICLHITGEPVSIGRLDQALQASGHIPATLKDITPEHQEIIDSFWIKVGEKVNLNRSFFEDHQKWGNLAMGGASAPYPQGASFNQWGHQVTVGGTKRNGDLAYNSVTMMCLRAARRLPLNAPCLGLRVRKDMPRQFLQEAAKAILSGGAHPIFLNDDFVIDSIVQSGAYQLKITDQQWKDADQKSDVPFSKYKSIVSKEDARDYSSDGCYEFLISGKCWFCLSGLPTLVPLQLLLNEGKQLISAGTRFIHGKRTHYELYPIAELQKCTYNQFEDKYFDLFKKIIKKNFNFQLRDFGQLSGNWTTSLLNCFTDELIDRQFDFYSNGTKYNQFCPQYTGISNLVNSLWNIKKYVFDERQLTLEEVRLMLLTNWGTQLIEPFVAHKIPNFLKGQFQSKCHFWRKLFSNSEQKFGIHPKVSTFGIKIAKKIATTTVQVFSQPNHQTLSTLKKITKNYTNQKITFGLQIMPGCGTFENYQDNGFDLGASFDGRLKSESVANDFCPQPYYADYYPPNKKYKFRQVLTNYRDTSITKDTKDPKNPKDSKNTKDTKDTKVELADLDLHILFSSGSVLDFNIDETFDEGELVKCLELFASGVGPNVITVTVCNREHIEEIQFNKSKDLLRFRMGGWTQFGVAMFPDLLNHHIRRIRTIP